jgi:hypothetical protein
MRRLSLGLFLVLAIPMAHVVAKSAEDPSTWRPVKIPGRQKAPEFADITAWVNSPPLTMAKLKGKVVVVHFLAFG